jgi:hypothetical protein
LNFIHLELPKPADQPHRSLTPQKAIRIIEEGALMTLGFCLESLGLTKEGRMEKHGTSGFGTCGKKRFALANL